MNILFRYIIRNVLAATAMVILLMTAMILIINFLDELRDIGSGDYGFIQALLHVFLELPNNLYHFFPMIVLLGAVLGLGMLASHQELVVMRAAGYANVKVILAGMVAISVTIAIMTLIGECLAPKAHHLASIHKQSAENSGQAVATQSGVWIHEGNNFLNIKQVIGLKHLEGVTRYEFDDNHQLLATYFIPAMDYENKQWRLHAGVKTTLLPHKIQSENITADTWDVMLNPQLLNVGLTEPMAMSLPQLQQYAKHLSENGLQASEFQFEFWKRLLQPFASLVMILLAMPLVMRTSRNVTMGWRIVVAIMVGFIFYMLNALLGQFSIVYQISPFVAALFPTLLFALVGIFVVKRNSI